MFGRAEAYGVSLFFYVIGFIIIATSQNISNIAGGVVLYAIGNTGTQIMQQIVIADTISAKWRGAAIGLVSLPYIINFGVSPKITAQIATPSTWRWGPGMFCIIMPVAAAPIIFILALNQRTAKKRGLVAKHPYWNMSVWQGAKSFFHDVDVIGLFLICAGWLLLLIPLQIAKLAPNGWQTGYIIAMLVLGGSSLIGAGIWEFFSPNPILKARFILNKDVVLPTFIGFFDFIAFYVSWTPVYQWSQITFGWSVQDATYFSNTQSLCLTVFGIAAGFISVWTRRFKWQMVAGCCIRLLGIGLMFKYRSTTASTVQAVFPQVLQGLGGGIMGVTLQVAAQVSVPHQDVAMVTAFVLLLTEIGGACGSAIGGSVMTNSLPTKLANRLPELSAAEISAIYASGGITTYPLGSPVRDGIIAAWSDYMHILLIIAAVISAIPIVLAVLLTDRRLTDSQNCVTEELADGTSPHRRVEQEEGAREHEHKHEHQDAQEAAVQEEQKQD